MNLSKNFTLASFIKSNTAHRLGIDNIPLPEHIENAKALMKNVWQPARDYFGAIICTSGYRCSTLNKAVGGSETSSHCVGEAMDGEVASGKISNLELARWISENCEFDQVILEYPEQNKPNAGWVHASYKRNGMNRKQVLTMRRVNGKIQYTVGLPGWAKCSGGHTNSLMKTRQCAESYVSGLCGYLRYLYSGLRLQKLLAR